MFPKYADAAAVAAAVAIVVVAPLSVKFICPWYSDMQRRLGGNGNKRYSFRGDNGPLPGYYPVHRGG